MEQLFTIDITCDFCGLKTGERTFSSKFGWSLETATVAAKADLVDVRCDSCEALHGNFKDMAEEYIAETGDDWIAAESFVVSNPKRKDFDKNLGPVVLEREQAREQERNAIITNDTPLP